MEGVAGFSANGGFVPANDGGVGKFGGKPVANNVERNLVMNLIVALGKLQRLRPLPEIN
jgi:hypothetical protein